ncbi:putative transglycosylase SceD precursor [Staphylococcus arlettae]|uniref:transglycosylase family protein n=1 Tax=Staphylococcus arlettae TaxID=29378 RepID=UPI00190DC75E|nr:transglycosylase family protein [Staphylococcus arlettae]MBK3719360.1 putative transglycosylase SceD precursor [Staphylococcus arlettae]
MKKTVITSTLALGLGVTGVASGQADASEQGIDKAQLAHTAQNNPQQLNDAPIHEGAYNYDFNHDKVDYNFDSDGTYWSWSYNGYGQGTADTNAQSTQDTEQSAPAEQATSTEQSKQAEQPQQTAAPQTEETQQPQQESTSSNSESSSEATSGSSVNVNSHLQTIAQRESGGDITAINPSSGAAGKYQFLQATWDSVAPAEYVGVSPAEAPESVQDAAAVELYNTVGPSQWVTA